VPGAVATAGLAVVVKIVGYAGATVVEGIYAPPGGLYIAFG